MVQTVYIIDVETRASQPFQYHKILQEGFLSLTLAQKFILSRSDKPVQSSSLNFKSDRFHYTIREITIK